MTAWSGVRGSWRLVAGVAVLAAVVWWTGTGPFVDGVRALDATTVALGVLLAVPATVASAWRWRIVARGLGVPIGLAPAVAGYYRSQLLNSVLPGGVVGDVHRGVVHGRDAGDTWRGLRAVAWERLAGQVVQAAVALLVLSVAPSPVRSWVPVALGALLLVGVVAAAAKRAGPLRALPARVQPYVAELRAGLLGRRTWPWVVLSSVVALACYVAMYVVAARAVGVTTSPERLVPLVLLVLLAAGLPLNIAGWGPREGAAGWAFASAGLGVDVGVATAVAFGALVLLASLPGLAVLAVDRSRTDRPERTQRTQRTQRTVRTERTERWRVHG